jgi:geranylgeranylglycerol-phosphate geranylgeranyltransferase
MPTRQAEAAAHTGPRSLRALAEVARWPNALIAAIGVLVGAWWVAPVIPQPRQFWAALAAIALTVYANAFNDRYDLEIDRVAHPERPLPRGAVDERQVQLLYLGAAVAAAGFSLLAHPALCLATLAVLVAMTVYTIALKRHGLVGNVTVAILASLPFVYGAASAGDWRAGVQLALVAAPLHLAREVAKDVDDMRGDAPHRLTIPLAHGLGAARAAVLFALALYVWRAAVLASPTPRLATALIPSFVLCALGAKRVLTARPGGPLLLKAAMLAAMAALVLTK